MAIDSSSKDVVALNRLPESLPVHNPHICGTGESLPRSHVEGPMEDGTPFRDAVKEIAIGSVRIRYLVFPLCANWLRRSPEWCPKCSNIHSTSQRFGFKPNYSLQRQALLAFRSFVDRWIA